MHKDGENVTGKNHLLVFCFSYICNERILYDITLPFIFILLSTALKRQIYDIKNYCFLPSCDLLSFLFCP